MTKLKEIHFFFNLKDTKVKEKNPKGVIIFILKTSIEARPASFILLLVPLWSPPTAITQFCLLSCQVMLTR